MALPIRFITDTENAKQIKPVKAVNYRIVGPWQIEAQESAITRIPEKCALVRTLYTGICHADVRYVSGSRPPDVMRDRLPMAPFHEAAVEIIDLGPKCEGFKPGQLAVAVPNLPCYVHDPWKYPSRQEACVACRPGGAGENFCADVRFLASNTDGMARTVFVHPVDALQPIPKDVPASVAVLAEPLSVAYAAVEPVSPSKTDEVVILGAGAMGYLVALMVSRLWNVERARLLATDLVDERLLQIAELTRTINSRDPAGAGLKELEGSFDIAFECAGGRATQATIDQAIKLLKPGGRCMLVGVSEEPVPIRTRRMLDKGLTLRGTTRSAYSHFTPILKKLADPAFQSECKRTTHPEMFPGHSVESILEACRLAHAPASAGRGKVIIDWTKGREK